MYLNSSELTFYAREKKKQLYLKKMKNAFYYVRFCVLPFSVCIYCTWIGYTRIAKQ